MPGLTDLAIEIGFECASEFDAGELVFSQEVRAMCASGRCKRYGKCWSCPPACGSIEALERRARKFSRCVLVQTVAALDGDFDAEGIKAAEEAHKRRFDTLSRQARLVTRGEFLPMGAGSCTRCVQCTYPDKPCRHPDKLWPSMEAYGLLVSDACKSAGLEYYHGPGTITYSSCILINEEENP
ncbi:MAG TPA: DUF2284 domain-containing protein [Candidatus Scatomorpha merdigallinarum]|nr:DUF2284 domain-containing protein [Candidatus Scatomorpha merdigallinarum]